MHGHRYPPSSLHYHYYSHPDKHAASSLRSSREEQLFFAKSNEEPSEWIITAEHHDNPSHHRQLSKHLKQLKEDASPENHHPPKSSSSSLATPQQVVIDYTQFSCDSMNDPNLMSRLHERLRQEEHEQSELQMKKRNKKNKKKKKKQSHRDNQESGGVPRVNHVKEVVQSAVTDNELQRADSSSSMQLQQTEPQIAQLPVLIDKCQFAKTCNDGEGVGFGATLFCSSSSTPRSSSSTSSSSSSSRDNTSSSHSSTIRNTLTILLLLTTLLLLFRLLNSTTDEFFSPGLEHFSLQLGLPPRFAGVTLLALGNGAPDVAATMNATLDSQEGYLMALGELTGTSMFVSGVILGVIVSLNDDRGVGVVVVEGKDGEGVNQLSPPPATMATMAKKMGVPCQGPLLRDIAVLSLVCIVSMSYLERGVVDYGFVYTLLAMYFVYVLTVLGADAYHLLYHLPRVRRSESGVSLCSNSGSGGVSTIEVGKGSDDKCCGGSQGQDQDAAARVREHLAANEQTPLVATSSGDSSHHLHNRHHSLPVHTHSIRDTVIEAMSNYTCDEEHEQEEQIVIFHPHHAVHPHHENGPMFLSDVFRRGDAARRGSTNSVSPKPSRSRSARQAIRKSVSDGITSFRSWDSARDKNQNTGVSSSSLSSPPEVKRLSSPDRLTTVITSSPPLNITSRSSVDEECAQPSLLKSCNNNEENNNNNSLCCASLLQRPNSWREAWRVNVQEFKEHWHDFFLDIYYNEENGAIDVILLSMELPFTIIRKLTNPVPCDGYYCRPLVAVSIILSPLWLWYYFNDQFGYDLSSTYIGYIFCSAALLVGIIVMRYAPGGDGPMDLYMVVPLTLYGFAIAATWLDSIADKLVELLELFGILLEIPSTIMGLTVLAFGNSLQDLIANVSLSRKGLSTMAVTACLAGPIFNLCIGLGLGFMALLKSTGKEEIHVKFPKNIKTGFYFTLANCVLIVIAGVFVGKGVLGRGYGYLACGLYLAYVVTSLYV